MAESSRQQVLGPDGKPYFPGTINATVYVLKTTDRWLPDEGPDGAIWSGGLGHIKANQHPSRSILDFDGTVLRAPLAGGEDPAVLAMAKISPTDRRTAAKAIATLGVDEQLRRLLLRTFIRQITPDQPSHTTTAACAPGIKVHADHVVMCWITAQLLIEYRLDTDAMLDVAVVTCRVTPSEHQQVSHLKSKPKLSHLVDEMLGASSPAELLEAGWERYEIQGVDHRPLDTLAEV
jgi:hypothetical protein